MFQLNRKQEVHFLCNFVPSSPLVSLEMKSNFCKFYNVKKTKNFKNSTSVEQNPREDNSSSDSPGIPRIVCNLKVRYHVHNSPSLVPILSHMNPVYALPSYLFIYFNSTISPMPTSSKWSLSIRFLSQNLLCISLRLHTC
jgi:hypothetical protein